MWFSIAWTVLGVCLVVPLCDCANLATSGVLRQVACEGQTLHIECPRKALKILSANYGRTAYNICPNRDALDTSCVSTEALDIVKKECAGKKKCSIKATNEAFSDNCVGTHKYLEVEYICDRLTLCEHHTGHIACPEDYKLEIVNHFYGRSDHSTCEYSDRAQNTDCLARNNNFLEKCHNRQQCTLSAKNEIFGDPCSGTQKYLTVDYKCVPVKETSKPSAIACENNALLLQCPKDKLIDIKRAQYGRKSKTICMKKDQRIFEQICAGHHDLSIAQSRCFGRNSCDLAATNQIFGDPCEGVEKYLEIDYHCMNKHDLNLKILRVREGHKDTIKCGTHIVVHYANYGRMSEKYFTTFGSVNNLNCHAQNSLDYVKQRCGGQQSCQLEANNNIFGDPCPNIYKYLEVGYSCKDPEIDIRFGD